jgi:hypothetical protein
MQSNAARAAVAVVSIAAVVILFVVLSGGDDDEGTMTTATAQTTTTTTTGEPAGKTGSGEKADKPEVSEVPLITVVGGQPEDGVADLSFDTGDEVAFEVTSDAADEVHVHGYDIEEELSPGKPAEITFPADIEGVFEVELHSSEAQIAQLTVSP